MAVPSPFQGAIPHPEPVCRPLYLCLGGQDKAVPSPFQGAVPHPQPSLPTLVSLSPLGRLMFFSPSHTCGPPSGSLARSTGGPRSHPQRFRSHCRLHPGRAASLLVKVSMFGHASTGTSGLPHLACFPDAQAAAFPLPLRMDFTSGASTQLILYPADATP